MVVGHHHKKVHRLFLVVDTINIVYLTHIHLCSALLVSASLSVSTPLGICNFAPFTYIGMVPIQLKGLNLLKVKDPTALGQL